MPCWIAQPRAQLVAAVFSQLCAVIAYLRATPFTGCAPQ
jgi:hypothetical protein